MEFSLAFLYRVLGVVLVDLILAGDNAILIGMAVRNLPPRLRKKASFFGALGAVLFRFIFIFFAIKLLQYPFLRALGGAIIIWIAFKLVLPEKKEKNIKPAEKLLEAVWIIVSADVIMSLDNVLAVAGIARENFWLFVFGIALSLPLVIFSSQLIARLMNKWPWLILFGGLFLAWIGGSMITEDLWLKEYFYSGIWKYLISGISSSLVFLWWLYKNKKKKTA